MTREKIIAMTLTSKANKKGLSLRSVIRDCGLDEKKAGNWIRGVEAPNEEELKTLCSHLGCAVEEIEKEVNKSDEKMNAPETAEPKETTPSPEAKKDLLPVKPVKPEPQKDNFAPKETPEVKETFAPKGVPVEKTLAPKEKSPAKEKNMEKTNKPVTKRSSNKKGFLTEENEARVRKTLGLKKSDTITVDALSEYPKTEMAKITDALLSLLSFGQDMITKAVEESEAAPNAKMKALIDAAKDASDEGIDVAITILKKFKKG